MRRFRCYILLLVVFLTGTAVMAQNGQWQDVHKVKRNETIFSIAKKYGITIDELIKVNLDMSTPGYELKKGDCIFVPYPNKTDVGKSGNNVTSSSVRYKSVKMGVVLPLHNVDGDGRRMIEYYRGLLMACDDLRKDGISVDVCAWNLPVDGDVSKVLAQEKLPTCDIVFGPLYTKQVKPLADFVKAKDIKMVIPFSINGNEVAVNPNIFQVYQSPEFFYNEVIKHFVYRFKNYHVVVIDCNDKSSDKGIFTSGLRKRLEERKISYSITNVNSGDDIFAKSFSASKPNMVILNTGRSPELNQVLAKLDILNTSHPTFAVSLFGYTEWLMYVKYNKDKFFKYDTYIPTASYYNNYSSKVKKMENKYLNWFKSGMMDYLPKFALTGYDHGMFFLRGVHDYAKKFDGTLVDNGALQTQLHFSRVGTGGGFQNMGFMFVHYNRNNTISTINF